ncbi:hypothetical protein AYI69_g2862 [Smittium culicis]|uniref:CCHC-type domain-containing protein n=1 Tax=Smittium culicis TaxID=133412 RepID=A0A1R1YLC1_9FUNG|nr:hypothetical protein AYI69_g2862 [Smittium culicis]
MVFWNCGTTGHRRADCKKLPIQFNNGGYNSRNQYRNNRYVKSQNQKNNRNTSYNRKNNNYGRNGNKNNYHNYNRDEDTYRSGNGPNQ